MVAQSIRYTRADVRKHAESVNSIAGQKIVWVEVHSPGDGSARYQIHWVGVVMQTVLGARAACDTLDAARYAIEAMKAAQEKAVIQPDQTRHLLSMEENGNAQ